MLFLLFPQANKLLEELEAALQSDVIAKQPQGVEPYLNELISSKERTEKQINVAARDGRSLVEIFQKAPIDVKDPASRVKKEMEQLARKMATIEKLWSQAWRLTNVEDKPTSSSVITRRSKHNNSAAATQVKSSSTPATEKPSPTSKQTNPEADKARSLVSSEPVKARSLEAVEAVAGKKDSSEGAAVVAGNKSSPDHTPSAKAPDHARKSPDLVRKPPDQAKTSPEVNSKSPQHVQKQPHQTKSSSDQAKKSPVHATPDHAESADRPRKKNSIKRRHSDRFGELEETAYQVHYINIRMYTVFTLRPSPSSTWSG